MMYPQINVSDKKVSGDISILFDRTRDLGNASLIPFQPDVFSANLIYFLLFICIGLPLILEMNYQFFSPEPWMLISQTVVLFTAFIFYRVRVYKSMDKLYKSGEARNGIFITKNYLVIRKRKTCQVFPRSSIVDIRSSWVSSGEDSMAKGIVITYLLADKEKEYAITEEYYGSIDPVKISKYLNQWLEKGFKGNGLINDLG
jgi:hypothetical protein